MKYEKTLANVPTVPNTLQAAFNPSEPRRTNKSILAMNKAVDIPVAIQRWMAEIVEMEAKVLTATLLLGERSKRDMGQVLTLQKSYALSCL